MKEKVFNHKKQGVYKSEVNTTRMARERKHIRTYTRDVCKIEFKTPRKACVRE